MLNNEKLVRVAVKRLVKEKKQHDEKFNQISNDITTTKERMRKNRKKMDLIQNK